VTLSTDDKVEIRELVSLYNKAMDTADPDGWVATFTSDGEFVGVTGTFCGTAALRAFAVRHATEEAYAEYAAAQHWVTNLVIEGSGDNATMFSHLMMVKPDGDRGSIILLGHYDDTLRRVDGQWRFARRVITSDLHP
jgi:uncharacterized protein (TIGR02246 family)